MSRRIALLLIILLASITTVVEAGYWDSGSWIDTGDARMRHRLQYLGDNNLIKAPLTTWPLNTVDVYTSMPTYAVDPERLSPHLRALYLNTREKLKTGLEQGLSPVKLNVSATSEPLLIRGFDDGPRDEVNGSIDATYTGKYATGRLKLWGIYNDDPHPDQNDVRFDESYLSVPLGNWAITPGAQTRWWGPGWDGSLILSNNARAFPGISLERQSSRPFDSPWLSWIGPWKLTMFHGQLEEERHVPDTNLFGMRFAFKPWKSVEFGLSRTAQWGGEGQPGSFSDFIDIFFGLDDDANKPGNQLGGYDFRWRSPFMHNKPFALYGQLIGEHEKHNLPTNFIGLGGIETWGYNERLKGSYRLYLEYANTRASFYKRDDAEFNTAYNHHIYQSGYRYLDDSLGHAIDSDSEMISVAAILDLDNGTFWKGWLKFADLNRDEDGLNPIAPLGKKWTSLGLSMETSISTNFRLKVGGFVTTSHIPNEGSDTGGGVFACLTSTF